MTYCITCLNFLLLSQGGGSALIKRTNILEVMVSSCSKLLNDFDKQFTVKTRTGIYANKSVAHELIPKFEEWGASLVTVIFYHLCFGKFSKLIFFLDSWQIEGTTLYEKCRLELHRTVC